MELLGDLIERHGWHVLGELLVLVLAVVVTVMWVRALLRGDVRPEVCGRCGRVVSRAHDLCPRCGQPLRVTG